LLKTTSQTVSEISYAVGFSSPSYFSTCYKAYFGESPTDVQRRTSQSGL
ncbi:MAG: helix-turn-helix domain-containing protein, partial [Muribaculaceae bacterium]|nr:helix-turn-helix domain-containing protein [Muribaculaceae bacterium]